jgi:hypothetical protein
VKYLSTKFCGTQTGNNKNCSVLKKYKDKIYPSENHEGPEGKQR